MPSDWRSPSTTFVVVVACVAVFTDIFLYGFVVPVFSFTLARRIGLPGAEVQRWTSAFLACYGGSTLLGSNIWMDRRPYKDEADVLPARPGHSGAAQLFALTTSLSLIVLARVLQGFSTAIVFTIGFSFMLDTVGNERIGHAVGFTSMSISLGLFGGPIIGGFLYDTAGYLAVFIPAFALITVEMILRLLLRPIHRASRTQIRQHIPTVPDEEQALIWNPYAPSLGVPSPGASMKIPHIPNTHHHF
ncbi:MFS amine transporter [Penicillium capsulatum]|uniref:MFS amine transporter n=1 Tax=Penicillium capsulatum TaxID=69766 RepID=A0A9W9IRR1_9EURO|nr:MFS amine transporter [Penicillium capsulatum]KAJ6129841.1 MFS amine transporter [Penicillium capsulatum]